MSIKRLLISIMFQNAVLRFLQPKRKVVPEGQKARHIQNALEARREMIEDSLKPT